MTMPKKTKGFGKKGRPTKKDVQNLKTAQALLSSNSIAEAYVKTHGEASRESAKKNAHRMLNEDVLRIVKELLQLEKIAETNKENLEKMLHLVVARYIEGDESGAVYVAALKLLSQLVPDFKERYEVDEIDKKSEAEIDKELKDRYGIDPTKFN